MQVVSLTLLFVGLFAAKQTSLPEKSLPHLKCVYCHHDLLFALSLPLVEYIV